MSRQFPSVALFVLFVQGALGELICDELPVGMCSFSIASSGKRCVLETIMEPSDINGDDQFQCKTSDVMAINMQEYIESEECVSACGVHRNTVGISSDSLMETKFTLNLCSPNCYDNCPNIVDLYYNLALAEGVFLPELCTSQNTSYRRSAIQLQSSASYTPISGPSYAPAPTTMSLDCAPPPM